MENNDLKRNGSGYYDPTAYKAIKKADADLELERVNKLIGCIFRICELSDFYVEERIVLRDKRTGKVWR
jgi:hypothetical protein